MNTLVSKFKKYLPILISVVVVGALIIVLGIRQGDTSKTLSQTSIRLKWINQAQFSGYYMAKQNGLYKKANLDVRIDPAGPNISPTQMVLSGANDFGIAGADEVLQARAKGAPLVAVATIVKVSPIALTSFKSSGITSPKDLEGKRVAVVYGNDENLYKEFLKLQNVDRTKINEVAALPGGGQLLTDQVDALMAYASNVPVQLRLQGKEVNVMQFSDYGVDFYGDTLFTTEKMIREKPELVKKFVSASVQGWKVAIEDQDAAINEVMKMNPSLDRKVQEGYLKSISPLVTDYGKLGVSEAKKWQYTQDVLYDLGVIKKKIDVSTVYTNRFLEQ